MSHDRDLVVIGVSVGLAVGIVVALGIVFFIRWYRKHARVAKVQRSPKESSNPTLPIRANGFDTSTDFSAPITSSVKIEEQEHLQKSFQFSWWPHRKKDQLASVSGILRYSYKDIQKATQNFTTILGQGSFGPVYKAVMSTGVVAVKVLSADSKQGEKEFQTEVSLLGRLHHRNLVNLLGYCVDKGQRMLIYEFMSNGSLSNLLYNDEERFLSWEERLQVALDISNGIEYLHEGAVPPVIHRDLKSANILLDQSMRAKVADFGLSKEEVFDGHNSGLKGTYGYLDPMYVSTNKFTAKSDIYSFGIIMYELITAIHPHQNLMEYINLASMSPDGVDEVLDKKLIGECNIQEVRDLASLAKKCLHKFQRKRPSIAEVSQAILKIKQKHFGREQTMSFASREFSHVLSRIEDQQIELSIVTTMKGGD